MTRGGVVLAGAAGIGKTRLARELVADARVRRYRVHWVSASIAVQDIPLGAFADVIGASVLPEARVVRELIDALSRGSEPGRTIVVVDDAHWLDPVSAFVVQLLVTRGLASVVVTVRTGEPVPAPVTALWTDLGLPRVSIDPLPEGATGELLRAALGDRVDPRTVRSLWNLTRGNVLYLRQVLEDHRERGDGLVRVDGSWRWLGSPVISDSLAELLGQRMDRLPEAVGRVVDVLALGGTLPVAVLAAVSDGAAVEAAEHSGLVSVTADYAMELAHPLFGEVRRARMGSVRARRLRGALALALRESAAGQTPDGILRRAVLHLDSDLDPDREIYERAGLYASQRFDYLLAERLLAAAITAGAGPEIRVLHAYHLSITDRGAECETALARLSEQPMSDALFTMLSEIRIQNFAGDLHRPDAARDLVDVLDRRVTDPAQRATVVIWRGLLGLAAGDTRACLAAARSVLATPDVSAVSYMFACWAVVVCNGLLGRLEEVEEVADEGARRALASAATASMYFPVSMFRLTGLRWAGLCEDMGRIAEAVTLESMDLLHVETVVATIRAYTAAARGDTASAVELYEFAHAHMPAGLARIGWGSWSIPDLAQQYAQLGNPERAEQVMRQWESVWNPMLGFVETDRILAVAWIHAARGLISRALATAREAAAAATRMQQPALEVVALHALVRFGDSSVAPRLLELTALVDGPRAPAAAAHAAALADDNPEALRAAAATLARLGDRPAAMDAYAHASLSFGRSGLRGSSATTLATARTLAQSCGGITTPALRAAGQPISLTGREREIAVLAAQGLSNRAIAAHLTVSVRTVEGHLYRLTTKLGGISRSDLGLFVTPTEPEPPR
nr:LuxR C-terminal-related transcriptional regulator [Nocardia crassostreae]